MCPDSIDQRGQLQICAASSLEKMPQHPAVEGQDQKKANRQVACNVEGHCSDEHFSQKMNLVISVGGKPRIRHGLANDVTVYFSFFKELNKILKELLVF